MSKNSYPKVVIVGRTNVGKSTLFNRLIKNKKSIVFDRAGVTRDYISEFIEWQGKTFELIDTGGIPQESAPDPIDQAVRQKALDMIDEADLVFFVLDIRVGITDEDRRISKMLHKSGRPVVVVLNKADNNEIIEENFDEFYRLGFENMISTSAVHGSGISKLLEFVVQTIELREVAPKTAAYRVVLLGRPNVGKSSLMNALLKTERSIVSPVAGTTREAISDRLTIYQEPIELTDTAGVRRSKSVDDDLETLMVKSSLRAVRESDIVILVVDVSEGKLTDQEVKLLFYAYEQKKCIIIVFNKTDLLDEEHKKAFLHDISQYDFILDKVVQVWTSCTLKKNIGKVLKAIVEVWERCNQQFKSSEIDEALKTVLIKKPMYSSGKLLKVFKIRNVVARIPTFILHVKEPNFFGESHLGFIENFLRKTFDLKGCPVHLILKTI